MPKHSPAEHSKPQHSQRLPGREAPSQGKQTGAVRKSWDAYQGERKEEADPSPPKPAQ